MELCLLGCWLDSCMEQVSFLNFAGFIVDFYIIMIILYFGNSPILTIFL